MPPSSRRSKPVSSAVASSLVLQAIMEGAYKKEKGFRMCCHLSPIETR